MRYIAVWIVNDLQTFTVVFGCYTGTAVVSKINTTVNVKRKMLIIWKFKRGGVSAHDLCYFRACSGSQRHCCQPSASGKKEQFAPHTKSSYPLLNTSNSGKLYQLHSPRMTPISVANYNVVKWHVSGVARPLSCWFWINSRGKLSSSRWVPCCFQQMYHNSWSLSSWQWLTRLYFDTRNWVPLAAV